MGVTGGIAAYKAAEVVSRLRRMGATTRVVMTRSAARFVAPLTFRVISGNPVHLGLFEEPRVWDVQHVSLARWAEVLLIVPATANVIGKLASGIADDMLTAVCLASTARKVLAPSMDAEMWSNPIFKENLEKLSRHGFIIIEPEEGRLASGVVGKGRLPDPEKIVDFIADLFLEGQAPKVKASSRLAGRRVIVTAGPTREPIDPVRFISNRSSGKMGYALAAAASRRGAYVTLVSGPTNLAPPPGVETIRVETARDMLNEVVGRLDEADVVVKAAAVCDFCVVNPVEHKIKKEEREGLALSLTRTPDILGEVGRRKGSKILVGFAAETQDLFENAKRKLFAKNLDMIVANKVNEEGSGFESDTNKVTIIYRDGATEDLPLLSKAEVADVILDRIERLLSTPG